MRLIILVPYSLINFTILPTYFHPPSPLSSSPLPKRIEQRLEHTMVPKDLR